MNHIITDDLHFTVDHSLKFDNELILKIKIIHRSKYSR